jgi:hypothetical protein
MDSRAITQTHTTNDQIRLSLLCMDYAIFVLVERNFLFY